MEMTKPAIKTRKSFPKVGCVGASLLSGRTSTSKPAWATQGDPVLKKKLSELNKIQIFMIKGPIESPV